MGLRAILPNRLAFALLHSQLIDHRRAKHHDEQQSCEYRAAGAECDVPEDVESADLIAEIDELVEHLAAVSPFLPTLKAAAYPYQTAL